MLAIFSFLCVHSLKIIIFIFSKCVSNGELKNFAKPRDLILDQNSIFYEMTKSLNDYDKHKIFAIVNKNTLDLDKSIVVTNTDAAEDDDVFNGDDESDKISEQVNLFQTHTNYGAIFTENKISKEIIDSNNIIMQKFNCLKNSEIKNIKNIRF